MRFLGDVLFTLKRRKEEYKTNLEIWQTLLTNIRINNEMSWEPDYVFK